MTKQKLAQNSIGYHSETAKLWWCWVISPFPVYSWGCATSLPVSLLRIWLLVPLLELIQLRLQLLRDQKHYCTQIPVEYQAKSSKSLVEKSKIIQDSRWTCEVPVSPSGLQLGIYPIHLELIRILAASLRTIANIIKLLCIRAFCCNQQMYACDGNTSVYHVVMTRK